MLINRVLFDEVEGCKEVFTIDCLEYLIAAHDEFTTRIQQLRIKRLEVLNKALRDGIMPGHLEISSINTQSWKVQPVPQDLKTPGIEISGPVSLTSMFINALNPGPDGTRADGDLDDDEDSAGHTLLDTVTAAINRLGAVNRTLRFDDGKRGRQYSIQDGDIPFFMHRERGIHLDEPDFQIDGCPIPAAILGTGLTLFHVGRAQMQLGQGVYFYLPKLESAEEAEFYKDFFDFTARFLNFPVASNIKAIVLIESLPIVYQMEEVLYALGPYAAGLNAARWDLKASILEYVMNDPQSVWPDRFDVDIKSTEFLANIFRRLVSVCIKRGAVPIGGMATALPEKDVAVNKIASESIKKDKEWEADLGFLRAWVAHIFHMKSAADPFKNKFALGWDAYVETRVPELLPVEIKVPNGSITIEGTRRNLRTLIEYLEGWLDRRGAKAIDSLEGRPGTHFRIMEDLATARISVAQTAQRILHSAVCEVTGKTHDVRLVEQLLMSELEDILELRMNARVDQGIGNQHISNLLNRYKKAAKIALMWVENYINLDFRSLGSYKREELESIAGVSDVN